MKNGGSSGYISKIASMTSWASCGVTLIPCSRAWSAMALAWRPYAIPKITFLARVRKCSLPIDLSPDLVGMHDSLNARTATFEWMS